ncbi:ABC transporter substrate-binding protein [Brevibacillus reuszeri]|uniref:ABC transporter substrate-binding protein n=1 Tax=Brevibacillus reuszeri TaxID=54915 RepID=A0A0K9YL12_9BACL|nr:ABC transporter substrate-binding protein [Brevibacillus reuszeri]KNB69379.1 ABC transporter substrate-binding protein [Brevibacillus reuszeri]MED1860313.1 ABC transporter substrate-binding protein [Brevibacillus reuszeri]GED70799.1 ABC transporter substrate-binding protein [Brevibacillus reuszeri]
MRIRTITTTSIALLLCLIVLVNGCSSAPAPSASTKEQEETGRTSEPKKGGTITIGYPAEPDSLDVQKSAMIASSLITSFMGGALVYYDPQTQEIKPSLAESYSISEDGKKWTFILRTGITFHDGTPLTARAYKYTLGRALDPGTASPLGEYMFGSIQSIEAQDDRTLILNLKQPSAQLLSNLWDASISQPLSREAVEKHGSEYGRNPVSVGPWKFENWKTGESITMVRNDAYQWGNAFTKNQGPPAADKLVIKFIKDNQTMMAALESGAIDIAANVPAKEVKKYRDRDKVTVLERMAWGVNFLEMNTENEILRDVQVRKAISLAINKEAILNGVLQGEGEVAHSPLPSSLFGYDPASAEYGNSFNVEEAKKQLEAAGWAMTAQGVREKAGKPLTLNLLSSENWSRPSQLVQGMLKSIGIDVKIQTLDQATLIESAGKGMFDLAIVGYVDNDPNALSLFFHSKQINSLNHSRVNNKQLDSLLERGLATINQKERAKIYADIQRIVIEEAYWVPLYMEKEFYLVSDRVHGVGLQPMYGLTLQDSWVDE